MKNITSLSLILAATVALAACDGDDTPGNGSLKAPQGLQVVSVAATSALVSWEEDAAALYHDVCVPGVDTLAVESASSCEISGLQPNTTYTWKARARNGETVTAWVDGPAITTGDVALNAPRELQVTSTTYNSALLLWEGDTTALYHDVCIPGVDTLSVVSFSSCGIDGLEQNTTYTWKVRARRGETVTAWVDGPTFKTEIYDDARGPWVGEWYSDGKWTGSVTLYGNTIPYEQFSSYLPDTLRPGTMGTIDVTIELAEENGEKLIAMEFPAPPFPGAFTETRVVMPIVDGKGSVERPLTQTIPVVTAANPVAVRDLPFIESILGSAAGLESMIENLSITEFTVHLTKITFTFGPVATDTIPVVVVIDGTTELDTDNTLANILLDTMLSDNRLKITIHSSLYRKEE
ncbi:MAG: fibronectin type III domain-containing protein [Odoribacteraceae bacterium]|jgi:hypothetical protein|nr:fibronectin type III domain-containing protein [Odoribacteraceae bacterium]